MTVSKIIANSRYRDHAGSDWLLKCSSISPEFSNARSNFRVWKLETRGVTVFAVSRAREF